MTQERVHDAHTHWIDGRPFGGGTDTFDVFDPDTDAVIGTVTSGTAADVDAAVRAARAAFPDWSRTGPEERAAIVHRLSKHLDERGEEIASLTTREMGLPINASRNTAKSVAAATATVADSVSEIAWREEVGQSLVVREPIGVVGAITPWNYPMFQIMSKVAPALVAGNTVVLKPAELAPLTVRLLAEASAEAGVPPGVLNIVHGSGSVVGEAITTHPDVDMIAFTGSTAAGRRVSAAGAGTIKRVALELGGKSASVVLEGADLDEAVRSTLSRAWMMSGQVCAAWSRLLVPAGLHDEVVQRLVEAAEAFPVGRPFDEAAVLGPLVSEDQRRKVDGYIRTGLAEGARAVVGGPGRPEGLETGAYVRPTVLTDVAPDATVAQEEIFGPVLSVIRYTDEEEAVEIANSTPYGLHGAVFGEQEHAMSVAMRMRTGQVNVNHSGAERRAPFGGYGQSGNGREFGRFGIEEQLEVKAIM